MLKQQFVTSTFPTQGTAYATNFLMGMYLQPAPDPTELIPGDTTILPNSGTYLCHYLSMDKGGTPTGQVAVFDSQSGDWLFNQYTTHGGLFQAGVVYSAGGNPYYNFNTNTSNQGLSRFDPATLAGDISGTRDYLASDFTGSSIIPFVYPVLDENNDFLINVHDRQMDVYKASTHEFKYTLNLQSQAIAVCYVTSTTIYVLGANCVMALIDYSTGSVLNTFYLPPLAGAPNVWDWQSGQSVKQPKVVMLYNFTLNQLYLSVYVTDSPTGTCRCVVYSYRMMKQASHITVPIPLDSPRSGKTIRVMTQITDELNNGVGGALVYTSVGGNGSIVNSNTTDGYGRAISKVLCGSAGVVTVSSTASIPDVT